ncbi:MAG: hypothetical protein Q8R26_02145 [bacterium]|nr:hypothetical protein [bacterium]
MKIFTTNHDVGSTQAMIPPLKKLQAEGVEVVAFAHSDAPAFKAFKDSGLPLRHQDDYGFSELGIKEWMVILDREKPDLIFVGISEKDSGSEKQVMHAIWEKKLAIPIVAICESWPHKWLSNFGGRDIPLYNKSRAMLVFDECSKERLVKAGFSRERIVVTGNPTMDTMVVLREKKSALRKQYRKVFGVSDDTFVIAYPITNDFDHEKEVGNKDPEWIGFYEEEALEDILLFIQSMRECRQKDIRVILRQKPWYKKKQLTRIIERYGKFVLLDASENHLDFLFASDVVIGTTTLMLESSAFLGIPTVSYLPKLTRPDPKFSNSIGLTMPIYKKEDLLSCLKDAITNPELGAVFVKNNGIDLFTDATARVAKALKESV